MVMDFDAITNYWFGEVKVPQFPLEPLDLGVSISDEAIEFRDPFEGLRGEEEPIKETPEPEEEEQGGN